MSNKKTKEMKKKRREKRLLRNKQYQILRNTISTGEVIMYHFTTRQAIEGIKRYGLCFGDVIDGGIGKCAVNLTEQGHYHDPSMNGSANSEVRITVKMNTKDCVNAKRFAKKTNTLWVHKLNDGNVSKHWYFYGQIKTEDFLDVCLWNGKEYVSVSLKDIEDGREKVGFIIKKPQDVIYKCRLQGLLLKDKSGFAIQATNYLVTSNSGKVIYALTDAVNEYLFNSKAHKEWIDKIDMFDRSEVDYFGKIICLAVQILVENHQEIPEIYLNSEIEKKNQLLSQFGYYSETFMQKKVA